MFNADNLGDELLALKGEVSRLLNTTGERLSDASRDRAEALADQIKVALNDLGKTLGEQEDHLEDFISDRPITSLASAFALGVVVGFMNPMKSGFTSPMNVSSPVNMLRSTRAARCTLTASYRSPACRHRLSWNGLVMVVALSSSSRAWSSF